ncbi:peptidoglycan-binding domain-containing protein [Actinosynnema sp. NPDC002837]
MRARGLRYGAAGLVAAALGAVVVVSAAPASAAVAALCTTTSEVVRSGRTLMVPTVKGSTTCTIGRDYAANTSVVSRFQSMMSRCYPDLDLAWPYSDEKVGDLSNDGSFGPRTEAALKAVQRAIGTADDGIYGPNTRDRMKFPKPATDTCYQY